jgi:hypothetical protein
MPSAPAARRPAAALFIPLVVLALPAASSCHPLDSGVKSCPGSPMPFGGVETPTTGVPRIDAFDASLHPLAPPRQLLFGKTRATPGLAMAGHLAGTTLVNKQETFSFLSQASQVVSGTITKKVVDATDGTCDYYYTVAVAGTSALAIDRILIEQFLHPNHQLFAAWRNDVLPMGVPPDHAQRTAAPGDTITFKITVGVQPGQSSRPMLLDSDVGSTKNAGSLRLRATDGSLSDPIPAWVPNWP